MKKYLLLIIAIAIIKTGFGQTREITVNANKTGISEVKQEHFDISIKANTGNIFADKVNVKEGRFIKLSFPSSTIDEQFGYPALPVFSELLEIPVGGKVKINIVSYDEEIINLTQIGFNEKIFPNQPPLAKNQDPATVKFYYNERVYKSDEFLINQTVRFVELGIMRGKRIGKLLVNPIRYNPVKNIIKIKTNIIVEVVFENADITATKALAQKYHSPLFEGAFGKLLNSQAGTKDQIVSYPVKYVIVSDPLFQTVLQPFVAWKTKKGFNVIEAYTNNPAVGTTTTTIKSYLQGLYTAATASDPAPSFVLLVGDVAQVPAFSGSGHVTDLYYCEYDGSGDYFPEAYYGRFSATNIEQLQAQIDKTLEYEQYLMPSPSFLDTVVMVSGVDASYAPTYGNGQITYGTTNYFNSAHGIYSNTYLYPLSGSSATQIRNDISAGCSFANYTAHGSSSGWANPSFTVSDVASMTNIHKYPLMIGNACVTNKFDVSVCFGEALLRAEDKGAIGYIGASNNSYWTGDFYWGVGVGTVTANPTYAGTGLGSYDRTFHDNGEATSEWFPAQGQMIHAGNLAVSAGQSASTAQYYWEIYHLMGDPSLMVYFSEPSAMTVTYNSSVPVGTSSLQVSTESYAYVALSLNGALLDAQYTGTSGIVTLTFPSFSAPVTADVVVTKQNRQPYIGTLDVIPGNTPFVEIQSFTINDAGGNNNGFADYNESILLNIILENIGSQPASNVVLDVNCADPYITLTDSTESFGTISASATATANNALAFNIAGNVPDQHSALFTYTITATGGNSWLGNFNIVINAPSLTIGSYVIDDVSLGNGDGILDAGESASITIDAGNNGGSNCYSVMANLVSNNTLITISNSSINLGTLLSGTNTSVTFNIQADASIAIGTEVIFTCDLQSGVYQSSLSFSEFIGIMQGNYCIPSSNCNVGDEIDDFSFNTISQTATGCGIDGYS
ncbi:MAG: C25 family cysteine peptidase, partial [Bacteroidota bacterium]|nr:C25 family cysteine peptidase [Bacteroidota bacterium]